MNRRLLIPSLAVEAVAVASVVAHGHLALVSVAVVYWIDLAALNLRVIAQRLFARRTRSKSVALGLLPFRLLRHKRGGVSVVDGLAPIYPRNIPEAFMASAVVFLISVPTTTYVLAVHVPPSFWKHPATVPVLVGAVTAASAKTWLILKESVREGVHETKSGQDIVPTKRVLLFVGYAAPLYVVADTTAGLLSEVPAENDLASVRNGVVFWASVLILLRLAYAVRASHRGFGSDDDTEDSGEDDGSSLSWLRSKLGGEEPVKLTPPSEPDGRLIETVEPRRASVLAAGVVNAVTTGGVVDREFSYRGLEMRVGAVFILSFALLALFDGATWFFLVVVAVLSALIVVLSVVSILHMKAALGCVEYRFYDTKIVAYDRRIGEPQWAVPHDEIRNVTVDGGLFGGPLWMDAGTVFFDRTDSSEEDKLKHQKPRSSLAFVPEPDRVAEILRSRGGR